MKKTVVCLLTAVTIVSTCLAPVTVFATDNDTTVEKAKSDDSKADKETNESKSGSNESEDLRSESEKNEPTKDESSEDKDEKPKPDKDTGKEETTSKTSFKPNDNLSAVKEYMCSFIEPENGYWGAYLARQGFIPIGFKKEGTSNIEGKKNVYLYPKVTYTGYNASVDYADVTIGEDDNIKDDKVNATLNKWYSIDGVEDMSSLNEYVLKNKDKLQKTKADTYVGFSTYRNALDCVDGIIIYTEGGSYVGTIAVDTKDGFTELYDEDLLVKKDGKIELSEPVLSKDAKSVTMHFSYDYENSPAVLGEEKLISFEIKTKDGGIYLDGVDTSDLIYRNKLTKGTTKDFEINVNGSYVLEVNSSTQKIKVPFRVSGIKYDVDESTQNKKAPKISYGELPNGILKGTPYQIKVFTDVETSVIFNGESDGIVAKEHTFTVKGNGTYSVVATSKDGAESVDSVKISGFVDDVSAINLSAYGDGGTGILPQTGGIATVVGVISGFLAVAGGILLFKKDSIVTWLRKRKKVSK